MAMYWAVHGPDARERGRADDIVGIASTAPDADRPPHAGAEFDREPNAGRRRLASSECMNSPAGHSRRA
jgi:hypothetical protein